ncbi:hypothetical protein ACI2IY_01615 [Lysobacter enzymogenes]|uniref:hypothetical protein n=1 Tax=Gammaproteobacteria TaxID=1236 RepID=UPI00381F096B
MADGLRQSDHQRIAMGEHQGLHRGLVRHVRRGLAIRVGQAAGAELNELAVRAEQRFGRHLAVAQQRLRRRFRGIRHAGGENRRGSNVFRARFERLSD